MLTASANIELEAPSYVLITAARNEEDYINQLMSSVIAQTKKPLRWVIVSDGSTDMTDDIVKEYAEKVDWIQLLRMPSHIKRNFASKSHCIRAAWDSISNLKFEFVAICDADISFDPYYIDFLLGYFLCDPKLGVAGTPFVENVSQTYDYRFTNIEHVSGGFQIFRRDCFDDIGGYTPVKIGGEDWIAVTTARMKGWRTRTFKGKTYNHLRPMGSGDSGPYLARFKTGYQDYLLGGHPIWEFFRSFYQMKSRPMLTGGFLMLAGYLAGFLTIPNRPVPKPLIRFHRKEQIERLKKMLFGRLS